MPKTLQVLHFDRGDNSDFIDLVDCSVKKATGLPVTEISFINGDSKVVLALGAEFNGALSEEEIVGSLA
jgi:hypothetical protein